MFNLDDNIHHIISAKILSIDLLVLVVRGLLVNSGSSITLRKLVELIFVDVKSAELEPEACAGDEGEDSDKTVVPHQERVGGEANKSLSNGGRECSHEEGDGLDHGSHILGGLGKGILKRGDGGEHFRQGDQDVRTSLRPNVDGNNGAVDHIALLLAPYLPRGILATLGLLVDGVLDDGSPDHGGATDKETSRDLLDGSELDTGLAESRVDKEVVERNKDEERKGVQVGENVVGETMTLHEGGLRDEVVVDYVVLVPCFIHIKNRNSL